MMASLQRWRANRTLAHVVPFGVFMALLTLGQFVGEAWKWEHEVAPWWRQWPEQFFYPLQTAACLGVLAFFWRHYELRWSLRAVGIGIVFGVVGIAIWLAPTTFYDHWGMTGEPETFWQKITGLAPRQEGFDPTVFGEGTWAYWASLMLRITRAVVVVALVEEIFWRGFLMRYLLQMDGDYWKVPFGQPSWLSFGVVTGAFVLAHSPLDWLGAFCYGALTYVVCVWTRSLVACVVMHATANFCLALYALSYGKYGLW